MIHDTLILPYDADQLLLHSCCAPCAGAIIERLVDAMISFTIFFYNPNIHPEKEYLLRKEENIRLATKFNIPFVDADYDTDHWFSRAKGMENEPERGKRCTMCFDMRLEHTAQYADQYHFTLISSTLGISRWKNMDQINASGIRATTRYPGIHYWTFNWRKQGGSQRMIQLAKEEQFYQQEYCGCAYSLRDTNRWRIKNGRQRIKTGEQYYTLETVNNVHSA